IFQAEGGIRDFHVTGVQTCALPIWPDGRRPGPAARQETAAPRQTRMTTTAAARATHHGRQESTAMQPQWTPTADDIAEATITHRSAERRVRKKSRSL